ncbi:hypothetical protein [Paraburkholderia tropica]|uniref:hypothetical protein n=1 Tax=Paraburkholderia tropica TaxID=92647 RepID=UPI002AB2A715|nr:hypothetical protein [Paraburkholderia tropica]
MREDIERVLLKSIFSIAMDEGEVKLQNPTEFARSVGISRQALYKSHRDVVAVLTYFSKKNTPAARDSELRDRINSCRQQKNDLEEKLKGAVKQNGELLIEIYELKEQLKVRGLTVVSRERK